MEKEAFLKFALKDLFWWPFAKLKPVLGKKYSLIHIIGVVLVYTLLSLVFIALIFYIIYRPYYPYFEEFTPVFWGMMAFMPILTFVLTFLFYGSIFLLVNSSSQKT